MTELVLWVGRVLVLGLLLGYLWAVSRRLALGVARQVENGQAAGETAPASLELVQDNAADGVALAGGRRVSLRESVPLAAEATLGRDPDNTVVIGDRFTSGRHARIFHREGRYWLEDLGSKNGTLLNGHRVAAARGLLSGDRITVGSCTFRFMG